MKNLILLSLFASLFFTNCKPENIYSNSKIEMNKTPCFGACPDYDVTIKGNGEATFEGRQHAPRKGNYQLILDAEKTKTLFDAFANADFWAFEDEYTSNISDMPTTFISFSHEGQSKKIRDYYGAPQRLKDLEKLVEEIVEREGWEKSK